MVAVGVPARGRELSCETPLRQDLGAGAIVVVHYLEVRLCELTESVSFDSDGGNGGHGAVALLCRFVFFGLWLNNQPSPPVPPLQLG